MRGCPLFLKLLKKYDMTRGEKAEALFREGYNCSQSVVLAFSDLLPFDKETVAMLSSSFGGGMGRLREVCGALSGAFIVAGFLKGYSEPKAVEKKAEHYALIQAIAAEFKNENNSLYCREILGISDKKLSPVPEERTKEYYKKRPCPMICHSAADIAADMLGIE